MSDEPSESFKIEKRHMRSYAPSGLKVLKGPGENFEKGSTWMVADPNGYAQFTYRRDENVVKSNSVYIENIEINSAKRGIDVSGFWVRHGFRKLEGTPEGKRIPMIKKIN